jgi:hypothetical protein
VIVASDFAGYNASRIRDGGIMSSILPVLSLLCASARLREARRPSWPDLRPTVVNLLFGCLPDRPARTVVTAARA